MDYTKYMLNTFIPILVAFLVAFMSVVSHLALGWRKIDFAEKAISTGGLILLLFAIIFCAIIIHKHLRRLK